MAEVTERDYAVAEDWTGGCPCCEGSDGMLAKRIAAYRESCVAEERAARLKAEGELEQTRVQLAGCGVAAYGGTKDSAKCGDYGWSDSYQATLDLRLKHDALEARLRAVIEAADRVLTTLEPHFSPGDERQRDAILAYRRVRDAQASPEPASPCSTSTCGNEACAKELRHVFHNRLDEQQRKEGEQEPCALCGRMLDDAIHASPESVPLHKRYERLVSAANKAVGQLADDVARDLDHDNRAHPKWWKAVQEERKALLALDASPEPEASHKFEPIVGLASCCSVCGMDWTKHGGRDGK